MEEKVIRLILEIPWNEAWGPLSTAAAEGEASELRGVLEYGGYNMKHVRVSVETVQEGK